MSIFYTPPFDGQKLARNSPSPLQRLIPYTSATQCAVRWCKTMSDSKTMHKKGARVKPMDASTHYRDTCPALTRPKDFSAFWADTLRQLSREDRSVKIDDSERRSDGLTLQWLRYRSLGGAWIHAYFLSRGDRRAHPLVIHTHGYVGQCEVIWQWAERGLHVFGFDIRGLGRSRNVVSEHLPFGYVLSGIETPHDSVLRGAVCDYVRAQQVAVHCLDFPPQRTIFYGHSFGGALALMAAAVSRAPDLLVTGVPTLGWAEGRRRLVQNGSGMEINRYLERYPEQAGRVMEVLRYFDTMNFADLVSCPLLIGLGLRDATVPAATVYAIINHLSCPHEIREFPVSHSPEDPETALWSQFEREWIELAVRGVPDSFGYR
jgi:cephalosporin-C deacetylase